MRLSDGTVFGLCYGLSLGLAQLCVLLSTEGATPHLRPALGTMAWALVYAVPAAAGIAALDWLAKRLDDHDGHGPPANMVTFLAIGWAFSALFLTIVSGARRIKEATGRDVLKEGRYRVVLIGIPIGLVCTAIYVFGPHLIRG